MITGACKIADTRKAALAAHAAAYEAQTDDAACSSARSAGNAAATAHVPIYTITAAIYAVPILRDAAKPSGADNDAEKEHEEQLKHLIFLLER